MPQHDGAVPLRRNGKQQACEPCRKGKMACDHAVPFCGRCVRRKNTAKCVYHPAPMTRKQRSLSPVPSPQQSSMIVSDQPNNRQPPQDSVEGRNPPLHPQLDHGAQSPHRAQDWMQTTASKPMFDSGTPVHTPSTAANTGGRSTQSTTTSQSDWKNSVFRRSAKYYGPSSFSAVFNEPQAHLGKDLLSLGEDMRRHPSSWPFGQPLLGRDGPSAQAVRMKQVTKSLWNIPSKEICENLLATYSSIHDITLDAVMIRHCISTLWSTFELQLVGSRSSEKLSSIAESLFRNEETPLPPAPDDGMDYLNTFMGPNIRFEMLGMLFCFLGDAYLSLQDSNPLFNEPENHGRDRKQTAWRMKECADVCLNICNGTDTVNELVVALMFNISLLESSCTGDESYQLRRRHGDLVTATITAGLHRLPDYTKHKPTAASEYKRRLFSSVYCIDKRRSSLYGTPPLLNQKFCNLRWPLDVSEEELFLPQSEFTMAITRLDPNGWNTSGELHTMTVLRAMWLLSTVREEILELSLGVDVIVSAARVEQVIFSPAKHMLTRDRELHERCQQVQAGIPTQLHYYSHGKIPNDSTGRVLYSQASLMLDFLQNKFLIDRIAIAHGFRNGQSLLNTAMQMMEITIIFWIKRDELVLFASTFEWIIISYGIPSAGVLCVELLKQAAGQSSLQFSPSDTIQKLSMFTGFLDWIRPTDGKFALAGRLKLAVRRILDHVLESPQKQFAGGNNLMEVPVDPMLDRFDEVDCMDWLNAVDWTQGPWMEFN